MIDIELLKILIMEADYPSFTDEELKSLCAMYTDINQVAYICCKMKAKVDKIKVGPIEIESNSQMWLDLADTFYGLWQQNGSAGGSLGSRGLSGKCIGRVDEF